MFTMANTKHLSKMNSVQVDFLRINFHAKSSHFFTNETLSYTLVYILPFMVILSFLHIEMSALTFGRVQISTALHR